MFSILRRKHFWLCCHFLAVLVAVQCLVGWPSFFHHEKQELFNGNNSSRSLSFEIFIILFWTYNYFVLLFKVSLGLISIVGILLWDCFPTSVRLTASMKTLPLISFRVVTRGDYPALIKKNIGLYKKACLQAGLENFIIEILTEKPMESIDGDLRVKQIVVPCNYQTKRGTLFKGRNLQYCLEDGVSSLEDNDWIIHLDEDSLLTPDAVCGIANFVHSGKHLIGQGAVNYDVENKTSYATKFAMAFRLSFDYGLMRLFCKCFNRCSIMKGSFVACQVKAERDISFDGGITSSVVEFVYFATVASQKGYSVGWIEGEMNEQGALTVAQFIQQHMRGMYGMRLFMKCPHVEKNKVLFSFEALFLIQQSYIFVILVNIFFVCPFYPNIMNHLLALAFSHDINVGCLGLLKMEIHSRLLYLLLFTLNFLFGFIYVPSLACIYNVKSFFQKEIKFQITKKNT